MKYRIISPIERCVRENVRKYYELYDADQQISNDLLIQSPSPLTNIAKPIELYRWERIGAYVYQIVFDGVDGYTHKAKIQIYDHDGIDNTNWRKMK